jgi:hypothetical protein
LYGFLGNNGVDNIDVFGTKCSETFDLSVELIAEIDKAWADTLKSGREQGGSIIGSASEIRYRRVPRDAGSPTEIPGKDFPRNTGEGERMLGTFHTHPTPDRSRGQDNDDVDRSISCKDVAALAEHIVDTEGRSHRVGPGRHMIVRSPNCIFVLSIDDETKLGNCDNCCQTRGYYEGLAKAAHQGGSQFQRSEIVLKEAIKNCGLCYYKICQKDGKFAGKAELQHEP